MTHCLIIEDDLDIQFLLKRMLQNMEFESDCATSLLEALDYICQKEYSIIFLDNNLGDGLGIDFITTIKVHLPHSKIIMVSAHDLGDKIKALNRGANHFIDKPFTYNIIEQTLLNHGLL